MLGISVQQYRMGSTLCSNNLEHSSPDIFSYTYGEDNKEIRIIHNDTLESSLENIRPSLVDCEAKLKRSEKRFKDVTMDTEPILLACGDKELHCTFERPEVFLKPQCLRNKIYPIAEFSNCRPNNIVVGDQVLQYFGVFLCYLSNNPELIERIILTQRNSYGIAALQVIYDSKREVLFIDDYILCHGKKPLFSKPIKYTDMWPCLLEKAWFKIKSCLKSKINSVHPIEVFNTFLSYPIRRFDLTDPAQRSAMIVNNLINGPLSQRGFGCVITSRLRPTHKIGLSGRKHFYFLRAIQAQGRYYYYLRNPCGNFDFRGSLHDIPKFLEDQITGPNNKEEIAPGNFLLTEEEFDQQIESFFIVQYNPASSISNEQEISFANSFNAECYVKFQITKTGVVGLRLQQLTTNEEEYAPLTYLLLDVDRKAIIAGERNEQGCFGVAQTYLLDNLHQTFLPGTYILRMKKKSQNKNLKYRTRDRLIMSAAEHVKFEITEAGELKNEFIFVAKEIAKARLKEDKSADRDEIEHKVLWMGDIVVVYINKLNTGKEMINLEVIFPELLNLECLTHPVAKEYTSLPPFQRDMLIVFEKVVLTESTKLGKYKLTPY